MHTPDDLRKLLSELAEVPGIRQAPFPGTFVPMLAALSETAFTRNGWIYEPKMDGIRGVTLFKDGKTRILSRRNLDLTSQYPSLARELGGLLALDAVIDGEIIALNELGRPSFQQLQQRMNLTREADVNRAEQMVPAYYFVFDIMHIANFSLLGVKLADRKKLLGKILQQTTKVRILQHFEDDGVLAYEACVDNGFEGIVAKRLESFYEPGRRSPSWVKLKAQQTAEFVLGGFTPGDGWRASTFGSLLLGYYDDSGKFIYAGSVGTGFDDRLLKETMRRIDPLRAEKCPFLNRPVEKRDALWLTPGVVVEIKFMDWTRDAHLRTPVFLRFRDDKEHLEITRERPIAYVPGTQLENTGYEEDDAVLRAKAAAAIRAKRLGGKGKVTPNMLEQESAAQSLVEQRVTEASPVGQSDVAQSSSAATIGTKAGVKAPTTKTKSESKRKLTAKSASTSCEPISEGMEGGGGRVGAEPAPAEIGPDSLARNLSKTATSNSASTQQDFVRPAVPKHDTAIFINREPRAVAHNILALTDVDSVISQLNGNERQFELIVQREKVPLTHLDKVLWPRTDKHPAILKRDFLRTIAELSPYLLGYLHNRPLTLVRSPDGVRGKRFYQKHWNFTAPEFMDTVTVSDDDGETGLQEYLLCNNLATLMFLAQNGVLEYHVFTSSLSDPAVHGAVWQSVDGAVTPEMESLLNHPDQLVFDLDLHLQSEKTKARPMDEGAFEKTRVAALMLRDVFLTMGLVPFVKTSGKNGVHVVLPIKRNVEYEVVRYVAEIIRQFMGKAHKEQIALDTESARRTGRVFLDHGPNGNGRTVVAPYSPRFAPEATISCPLSWEDFERADPASFNLCNITAWVKQHGDPWACLDDQSYDLQTVFQKNKK